MSIRLTMAYAVPLFYYTFAPLPHSHTLTRSCAHPSDPFVVIVLSLSFIASIFFLHIAAKIVRSFTK